MKTVYLVRHGESTENTRSSPIYLAGEAPLTELGKEQANFIAERASRIDLDVIISSTYRRAKETAFYISEMTALPVVESDLFVEHITPSSFHGRTWDETLLSAFQSWQKTLFTDAERHGDGENFQAILERAKLALKFLEEREERNILVVTHGMFMRALAGLILLQDSFSPQDFGKLNHTLITRNTGITVIRLGTDDPRKDAGNWHMLTWNDHAHLG